MAKKGIEAGRAYVKAWWDNSAVFRGIKAMKAGIANAGSGLKSAGTWAVGLAASIVTPLVGAAKVFADMGSDMLDLSQRTGVGVEALSELKYAAEQSGADVETLEKGLTTMARTMQAVRGKSKGALDTLKQLGLNAADLEGKTPDQQFAIFAEAISKVEDPSKRAALAMKVFGKGGTQLLPMMLNGAKGIAALRDEARALGITMSQEDAEAAEKFGDQMSTLSAVLKAKLFSAGAAVAPMLGDLVERLTNGAAWVGRFIDRNRALIALLFKVALGVGAAGAVLFGLGTVLTTVVGVGGAVATAIGGILAAVGFLLSPLGLALIAFTAIAAAGLKIVHQTGLLGRALDWLREKFAPLTEIAKSAFEGIKAALEAGDLKAAAAVLWAALQLAWVKGKNALVGAWDSTIERMKDGWTSLTAHLKSLWAGTIAKLLPLWHDFIENVGGALVIAGKMTNDELAALIGLNQQALADAQNAKTEADSAAALAGAKPSLSDADPERRREANRRVNRQVDRINEERAAEDALGAAVAGAKTSAIVAQAEADRRKAEAEKRKAEGSDAAGDTPASPSVRSDTPLNTAAIVGTDSGAEAFFKAVTGGAKDGSEKVASAVEKLTTVTERNHREMKRWGLVVMKGKT